MTTPPLEQYAPYIAALREERAARDFAYLDVPRRICRVAVRAMSLRDLITRSIIDCPFVHQRMPTPGEIGSFIWHLSTARARTFRVSLLAEHHAKQRILQHLATISYEDAIVDISEYIDYTFLDLPVSDGAEKPCDQVTSIAAAFIDRLAHEYGWSERAILDTPLVRIYQLIREIQLRYDPKAEIFNRLSTKARGDWLREINANKRLVRYDPNFAVAQIRSAIRTRRTNRNSPSATSGSLAPGGAGGAK